MGVKTPILSTVCVSFLEKISIFSPFSILPLSEIVVDFFDRLKSVSRGYASLDYSLDRYEESDVIKLDILLNGDKVDALAYMAHRTVANLKGKS